MTGIFPFGIISTMLTRSQITKLRAARVAGPNRLAFAMELMEVTHEQVAAGVSTSQSHVTEIANGNYSKLPLETARNLAQFFGCAIEDLFPAKEAMSA